MGIFFGIVATHQWELTSFGALQPAATIRLVICSVLFLLLGGQTLLGRFLLLRFDQPDSEARLQRNGFRGGSCRIDFHYKFQMSNEACADEAMGSEQPKVARSNQPAGNLIRRYGGEAIVVALALLLWLPRLSGPIDLRWDAGVYYVLGTSLATGHGYRILSEPGSPKALQYPPFLPLIVAAHQSVLNTTNLNIVGPLLRKSYAVMFVAYAVACLSLARRYLTPWFAVLAVTLCLLQVCTIYLSDLLFTELPFALIGVGFVLASGSGFSAPRTSLQEVVSFLLAGAAFSSSNCRVGAFGSVGFGGLLAKALARFHRTRCRGIDPRFSMAASHSNGAS